MTVSRSEDAAVPAPAHTYVDATFSADSSRLYAVSGNTVYVINAVTGAEIAHYSFGTKLGAIDLSPDGNYLAVVEKQPSGGTGTLYRLDVTTGNVSMFQLSGTSTLYDVGYLSDGRVIVSQQASAPLRVINLDSGDFFQATGNIPGGAVITMSADGTYVLALPHSSMRPIHTFDLTDGTGRVLVQIPDPYAGASVPSPHSGVGAVSPNGDLVIDSMNLKVFDSTLTNADVSLAAKFGYLAQQCGLAFSPDGTSLYLLVHDGKIVKFSTATWDVVAVYDSGTQAALPLDQIAGTITGYGDILSISPDGLHASVIGKNGIQLVNLSTAVPISGPGNDILTGSGLLLGFGGNDVLTGNGSSFMYGGEGDDTYYVTSFYDSVFELANQGHDTIHSAVSYQLMANQEDLILEGSGVSFGGGNELNNLITGSSGTNTLMAGGGNDTLSGGDGDDTLSGGRGSDQLDGGAGNDILNGGNEYHEDDGVVDALAGGSGNDTIYAGFGDNVDGGSGSDSLQLDARAATAGITADFSQLTNGGTITVGGGILTGIETLGAINATNFADNIIAGSAVGGAQMFGWDGDDRLRGSSAGDSIYGGNGNDILTGGLGQDNFVDDSGDDTFLDTAAGLNGDTIVGFSLGDKIIITDANLSSFTFQLSGNALTYSGGTLYLNSELPGRIVASAAAGGGVQLQVQLPPVATNDQIASQLTAGYWDGDVHRWNVTQGGTLTVNITMLSSAEQAVARAALGSWADIIGVQFQEVSSGGQIVFDNSYQPGEGPYALTDWSNGFMTSAVIHIPSNWITTYGSQPGSSGYETYVHEVGHALGLGHAGNYNFTASYVNDALFANDSVATTVMSYFDQSQNHYFALQNFSNYRAATPMQADIVAMQSLYGLSTTTRTGDTVYGFNSNAGDVFAASGSKALTIFDSGGNDTLDYSNVFYGQLINLNPETFSNVNAGVGNLAIARGTIIENAIGGFGTDTIIGNAASNTLTGNAGNDILTGGAGDDSFIDTAAGLNGDTITDFGVGEKIIITNANLASFSFSLSGSTLTFTGGTLTLAGGVGGTLVTSAAAGGGVQLTVTPNDVRNDFNGDGRSDMLWRHDSGLITDWLGTAGGGFAHNFANASASVATSWQVAGTGDFNGDGRDDILWRHDSGLLSDWLGTENGGFADNYANASSNVATSWQVAGSGDFNGDGKDDILWRHDSGLMTNWLGEADGGFADNYANASSNVAISWKVIGTGDFNGDGRDDILWRHGSGLMTNWLGEADGGFADNFANASANVDTSWHVAGTGDFNGDGLDDLLWRHDSGLVTNWLGEADGGFAPNNANAWASVDPSWQVAATGDYNGDGRDDILWRHDSGMITDWLGTASGGFTDNYANASASVATSWHVQSLDIQWV